MTHRLTFVICTHNRVSLLEKTIASLNEVVVPDNVYASILVIPNACTDQTVRFLDFYIENKKKDELSLFFEEEPKTGKSFALNRAISLVDDGFLCFIDDDHRVDPGYASAIHQGIGSYASAQIFCGRIIADWTGREPDWLHDQGKYKIFPLPVPHYELGDTPFRVSWQHASPGGGNLAVHRAVFEKLGVFSTQLGPKGHNLAGSEDSDLIKRALRAGIWLQYLPNMIQFHYVDQERLKFLYLVRKSYQRNRTVVRVAHPASKVPSYLWRKLGNNLLHFLFAFQRRKYRYYAMRVAGTLGEISGHLR